MTNFYPELYHALIQIETRDREIQIFIHKSIFSELK